VNVPRSESAAEHGKRESGQIILTARAMLVINGIVRGLAVILVE